MLTKNDLQQIRGVIQEETRSIVQEEIKKELIPVKKDIKLMKRKLNTVEVDLHYIIGKFDTRITENTSEIKKIKLHIGLAQ